MTEYEKVCFNLQKKENELEQLKMDVFTYNPKFKKLTSEISELIRQKEKIEETLKEENNE